MARQRKNNTPAQTPAEDNKARYIDLVRLAGEPVFDECGEVELTASGKVEYKFKELKIVAPKQIIDSITAGMYIQYYINLAELDKNNKKLASLKDRASKCEDKEDKEELDRLAIELESLIDSFKEYTADKELKPAEPNSRDALLSKAIAFVLVGAGVYASFDTLYNDMKTYYDIYLDTDENHQHQRTELRDRITEWADKYIAGGATPTYAEITAVHLNHTQFLDIVTLARNTAKINKKGWTTQRDKRDTVARRVLEIMLCVRMGCEVVTVTKKVKEELMM